MIPANSHLAQDPDSSGVSTRGFPHTVEGFHTSSDRGLIPSRFVWQIKMLLAGDWVVYFDGDCGFCRRWALRACRITHPMVRWRNFREHAAGVEHLSPHFERFAYLIIARQQAFPGFFAFRKLVLVSPRAWVLLPLAYFPGLGWLGPKVYDWIARRYGPAGPHPSCRLPEK